MNKKTNCRKKRTASQKKTVNRQHKDRLFRFLFQDKKHLLSLYNALNGTDYTDPSQLTITTLDGVIYMGMKNDLSFIVDSAMNLYEHQSSWNPNMPLRGLIYLSRLYQTYVKEHGYDLSGNQRIYLPTPRYVIFYNGAKEQPDHSFLLLSDAFLPNRSLTSSMDSPCLECRATMLNINQGHNQELLEKCRRLWEYAELIGLIRQNQEQGMDLELAVDTAVNSCLKRGILADVLIRSKMEVMDMLLEEYNEEETREYLRREAQEMGHAKGLAEGIAKTNNLNALLIRDKRFADLERAAQDPDFQESLFAFYHL